MGFFLKTKKLQDSIFLSKGGNFTTIPSSFSSISMFQTNKFYSSHPQDSIFRSKGGNFSAIFSSFSSISQFQSKKFYSSHPHHDEQLQTVPYSNRTRRIRLPYHIENSAGEENFKGMKEYMKKEGMILPFTNPNVVRVNVVFNNIIAALEKDLKKMRNDGLDWIGKRRVPAPFISHLDGLDWEVLVVICDCLRLLAVNFPGGKIVLSDEVVGTDIEIATIASHEVAHIVARHQGERFSMMMRILRLNSILGENFIEHNINVKKLNERLEFEADYIGLLLLASAGYDPQLVPEVHEKMKSLDKVDNSAMSGAYFHRHPSGSKRAKALARAKIMEEALAIYNVAKAGRIEDLN